MWGVAVSINAGIAAPARCDDPDEPDEGKVAVVQRLMISPAQFDQWVFHGPQRVVVEGGQRVISGQSATDVQRLVESILEAEIRTFDARCRLSEAQKKKLQLAGQGDIARWLNRVSELRRKCTAMPMDQQQYNAVMVEIKSVRYTPQIGPFDETSLLRKTLRKSLTPEQFAAFQTLVRERSVQAIANAMSGLDSNSRTKLVGDNRQKFIDTLVDHGNFPQTNTPYMQYIVWSEAGRLEDQLKPLLDETQRQAFQQQVSNARRVEQSLRQSGRWPAAQAADDESPNALTKD